MNSWNKNSAAKPKEISIIEEELNITLPKDYIRFLMWSDGGEGYIGDDYVSLWKIGDLPILNREYQIQKYLSDSFLGIGTDGGGVCYGLCIENNYSVFKCPMGDLGINEIIIVAQSIKDFLRGIQIEEL